MLKFLSFSCRLPSLLLLVFWAGVVSAQQSGAVKFSKVISSENDEREYRYITLSNNLRVLLISDVSAEKSAAALNVHVGSHQNPQARPGLAHFLEHMLFLGTEKYPRADDYQNFISDHAGSNNAYTAEENTNYFFDIEHAAFEPALDRFAQFFISPSFDAAYIEREKNAVNAEYLAKINDDERREWDVYRGLLNPESPTSIFSVGNLETLKDQDARNIRDDLINFYQRYYSASIMSLVVMSNRKLDDMQKMVEGRFSAIPSHEVQIAPDYPKLFVSQALPASVSIKPAKEIRQLSFIFPAPNFSNRYSSKPWEFISNLLGSESAGSLLALLKGLGWAEGLQAGPVMSSRGEILFAVTINLTKEGYKARDQIVSSLFEYLRLVNSRGVSEWRFAELKQIADIEFKFGEQQAAIDTVMELAQAMQDYPSQDVLTGKYNYSDYDDALIKKALSYLRKENVLVSIIAPEVKTDFLSTYYQAPFSVVNGIPDVLELKPGYRQKLFLPDRNLFIPKTVALKAPSLLQTQDAAVIKNTPALVVNSEPLKIWFLQDQTFHTPKAELNFRIKLPILNNSLESAARAQLFTALIKDQLNEFAYPARVAGLTFDIKAHSRGIDLNVAGYTDKQSLLVNKILAAISQGDFSESRFDKVKEDLIREWRNEDKNLPYSVLARKVTRLQYLPSWGVKEFVEPLQKTNFEQFKQFSNDFLRGAKIEALFYGNLYAQDAVKLSALIEHQLLQKYANRLPQLAKVIRPENKDNKSWLYVYPLDHNDRAVELYVQALGPSFDDSAHMMLLNQMLASAFYNELRTEKQLGYIVGVYPMPLRNVSGSFFVVQSPSSSAELLYAEISNFLMHYTDHVADNFSDNKAALIAELKQQPISLTEQSERFWQSVLLGDADFSRRQELLNSVSKITPESLRKYYESAFLQKNRRLWLSSEKIDNAKDFELIQNVAEYQQKQQGYLFP